MELKEKRIKLKTKNAVANAVNASKYPVNYAKEKLIKGDTGESTDPAEYAQQMTESAAESVGTTFTQIRRERYRRQARKYTVNKLSRNYSDSKTAGNTAKATEKILNIGRRVVNTTDIKYVLMLSAAVLLFALLTLMAGAVSFGSVSGSNLFIMPFNTAETLPVTDEFGYRIHPIHGTYTLHMGTDFGTPHYCEILASASGEVTFAGVNGGYGNCDIIKHDLPIGTFYTLYAHLSEIRVNKGNLILQGEIIGLEGGSSTDPNPGTSTGHHLHFEIRDEKWDALDARGFVVFQ